MKHGDFDHGEKSLSLHKARNVKMVPETSNGKTIVLKPEVKLDDGDVIDSMFMSKNALCDFYEAEMEDAYKTGVMFSLHVKATMMKVSHPIVFGHAARYRQFRNHHSGTSCAAARLLRRRQPRGRAHRTARPARRRIRQPP